MNISSYIHRLGNQSNYYKHLPHSGKEYMSQITGEVTESVFGIVCCAVSDMLGYGTVNLIWKRIA